MFSCGPGLLLTSLALQLQKHIEKKDKPQSTSSTPSDVAKLAAITPSTAPNGTHSFSPASPAVILPIPMPSLDAVASHPPSVSYTPPAKPSQSSVGDSGHVSLAQIVNLEQQLVAANTALSSANTSIAELHRGKESLKSENDRLSADLNALKARYEASTKESAQSLVAQQESLVRNHSEEMARSRDQSNLQISEMTKAMDLLRREKAEMQGVVQLLQQRVANPPPAAEAPLPDNTHLIEEKAALAAELLQTKASRAEAESTIASLRQQLEALNAKSATAIEDSTSRHKKELENALQDYERRIQQATNVSHSESSTRSAEAEDLKSQLTETRQQLSAAIADTESERVSSNELRAQLSALNNQLAEKEDSLKRASEQAKSLQNQTSANFAQVEQMKQQVLRDRVELSKKLSLIAPETVRRVEQLTLERDAINQHFEELVRSVAEISKQKGEVLSRLAVETSRNTLLVKQNAELKNQLSLQLSALGEPATDSSPSATPIQVRVAELRHTSPTPPKSPESTDDVPSVPQETSAPITADRAEPVAQETSSKLDAVPKPHAKLPPRRKTAPKPKKTENIHDVANNGGLTHSGSPTPEAQKKGWLSSVPLVGRIWNGQPQVRHTAHVEI